MSVLAPLFSVAMLVAGVLAYRGVWRSWAFPRPVFSYAIGLGTLYLGLGVAVFWLVTTFGADLPILVQRVAAVIAIALVLVCLLSAFWFPASLMPEWLRRQRGIQRKARG